MSEPNAQDPPGPPRVGRSFAWRSAVVFLGVGVLTLVLIRSVVDRHFTRSLDFHAEFVVHAIVEPFMDELPDGPVEGTPSRAAALAEALEVDTQVLGIDVIDADGRVLLADDPARIGTTVTTTAPDGTHVTTVGLGDRAPATAMVVRQDRTPSDAAASGLSLRFGLLLLGGLMTLWALQLPLVRRLGGQLRQRATALETQGDELRRLLDREQETTRQLAEVSQMKDSFLAAVSHELRTPLTVISGMVTTLRRHGERLSAERRDDLLESTERNAARLQQLVMGLLDLSLDDATLTGVPHETVEIAELVSVATSQVPPPRLELDLRVPAVTGNRTQLERALASLIGNAVRHAPGSGVVVASLPVDGGIELRVSDRGPGVADELKQVVYEPFRQGPLNDAHAPGTGVGLALVARFVAAHGGCTWVSDRPGGGATFHVRLPDLPRRDGPLRIRDAICAHDHGGTDELAVSTPGDHAA